MNLKSEQVELYIICLQGHMWEQKMIRACNKHPVVSFTKSLGSYHVVCLGSVDLGSYCENIYARNKDIP